MSTLPRINVEKYTNALAVERQKLLDEAGTVLGYRRGQKTSLLNKLLAIGIVPFKTEAVEAYMLSKRKVGMWSGTKQFIWWLFATAVAIALAAYGDRHFMVDKVTGLGMISFVLTALTGANCLILFAYRKDLWGHGHRKEQVWQPYSFSHCERIIPDHVLNMAITIKRDIPNAELQIAALVEGTQYNPKPLPDPFLRVTLGAESYYVEQWNEKDFDRIDE